MRAFLKSVFHRLTGPIYRRLLVQLDANIAAERQSNLEYQERLVKRLAGEITQLRNLVQAQNEYLSSMQSRGLQLLLAQKPNNEGFSETQIMNAITDLREGMEPSMASRKHKIPADVLIDWSARYGSMDAGAVELIRQLESENALLRAELKLSVADVAETAFSKTHR